MKNEEIDKKSCKKEIEYTTYVSNGWNETFKTKCGWYMDGKKQYCKKCKKL